MRAYRMGMAESADDKVEAEQARWQDAIYQLLRSNVKDPQAIDGGGCDSGDPLDFTLAEIQQAINSITDG